LNKHRHRDNLQRHCNFFTLSPIFGKQEHASSIAHLDLPPQCKGQ
jgi:hypothetical protein